MTTTLTLSGPIVIENPHNIEGSTRTFELIGQMWISPTTALRGKFRYFSNDDATLHDLGRYFACIHVRLPIMIFHYKRFTVNRLREPSPSLRKFTRPPLQLLSRALRL
jgi:hypothetical protein